MHDAQTEGIDSLAKAVVEQANCLLITRRHACDQLCIFHRILGQKDVPISLLYLFTRIGAVWPNGPLLLAKLIFVADGVGPAARMTVC